jgi:hypothetical protein
MFSRIFSLHQSTCRMNAWQERAGWAGSRAHTLHLPNRTKLPSPAPPHRPSTSIALNHTPAQRQLPDLVEPGASQTAESRRLVSGWRRARWGPSRARASAPAGRVPWAPRSAPRVHSTRPAGTGTSPGSGGPAPGRAPPQSPPIPARERQCQSSLRRVLVRVVARARGGFCS